MLILWGKWQFKDTFDSRTGCYENLVKSRFFVLFRGM
nr:MAG TPA: hypothetical protein [Caudoviricetes sp.]